MYTYVYIHKGVCVYIYTYMYIGFYVSKNPIMLPFMCLCTAATSFYFLGPQAALPLLHRMMRMPHGGWRPQRRLLEGSDCHEDKGEDSWHEHRESSFVVESRWFDMSYHQH